MLAGVESPNVGRILGFGYEEEQPFLILERLHGETLADRLKRGGRIPIENLGNWQTWTVDKLLLQASKEDVKDRLRKECPGALEQIEKSLPAGAVHRGIGILCGVTARGVDQHCVVGEPPIA